MDKSQTSSTRKRKGNPNTQLDKQGKRKIPEALNLLDDANTNPEKEDYKNQKQMGQVEETTGNRRNLSLGISRSSKVVWLSSKLVRLNSNAYEVSVPRMFALSGIMEALRDADINIIGVYGPDPVGKADLLKKVSRRAQRDDLFDVVVMASVTDKPDFKSIQGELADPLGLTLEEKAVAKRAVRLRNRIKVEQKILVILQNLCKGLDLGKVGIPFGADHSGCKILLTSTSEEVLSNQMHAQKVFMA